MADSDARSSTPRRTRPAPARRTDSAPRAAATTAATRAASAAPSPVQTATPAPAPDRATVRPITQSGATVEPAAPPPGSIGQLGPAEPPAGALAGSRRSGGPVTAPAPAVPPDPTARQSSTDAADPASGARTADGATGAPAPSDGAAPDVVADEGAAPAAADLAAEATANVVAALRQSSRPVVATQTKKLADVAEAKRDVPAPETLVAEAEAAQTPPENEAQSRAQATSVDAVDGATAPAPDAAAAKRSLSDGVAANLPTTLKEVDEFAEGADMTAAVRGLVRSQTAGVAQTYGAIETTPPPQAPAVPTVPLPAPPGPPPVDRPALGADAVGTFPAEAADLSALTDASDQALADSGLTDDHLALVTDGPLAEARAEREGVAQTVAEAPTQIDQTRADEQARIEGQLKAEEDAGEAQMQADRDAGLAGARADQEATTVEMELKRKEVADHIQGIYDRANKAVTDKLDALEETSLARFEEGQRAAVATFERNVGRRMDAFKEKRYGGWLGWGRWIEDRFWDITKLPPVKTILDEEKAAFMTAIDGLLATVTADIERTIAECKKAVADAKTEIKEYVDGLGPDLKDVGQKKATELQATFAELDQAINQRRDALQAELAEKREAAIAEVETMIEDMRTGVAAALERLGGLLLDAAAKFIRWALQTAGLDPEPFFAAIRKAGEAVGAIASDPLSFLGNLIAAVRGGIEGFQANIKKHLVGGLIDWLTGAMSTVPIQLPETWDLKGILHLVLQILGLTYDRIRAQLVKRVGERPVAIAEKTVDVLKRLMTEGPIALWDMLAEKAGEIKAKAMEAIRGWAILQLVKAGVIKLVSMLNPAGAIVQGIITIFNVVMFFVENLQRILAFARSVIDSVATIAAGQTAAAAGYIEQTMARTIPILLGFLGRLIPVTGIGKAVQTAVQKVRAPIDRIVGKAIDAMVGLVMKLGSKAKAGAKKVAQGVRDAAAWVRRLLGIREPFTTESGERHTVTFQRKGKGAEVVVRSTPKAARVILNEVEARISAGTITASEATKIRPHITAARGYIVDLDRLANPGTPDPRPEKIVERDVSTRVKKLLTHIKRLPISDRPVPPATIQPGFSTAQASSMQVNYLMKGRPPVGTEARTYGGTLSGAGDVLNSMGLREAKWVFFHILNGETGGVATDSNLIPTTKQDNNDYKDDFEDDLKKWYDAGDIIWGSFKVGYKSGNVFPDSISSKAAKMTFNNKRWQPSKASADTISWSRGFDWPKADAIYVNHLPPLKKHLPDVVRDSPLTIGLIKHIHNAAGKFSHESQLFHYIDTAPDSVASSKTKGNWKTHIRQTNIQYGRPPGS